MESLIFILVFLMLIVISFPFDKIFYPKNLKKALKILKASEEKKDIKNNTKFMWVFIFCEKFYKLTKMKVNEKSMLPIKKE